jgi:hypothetical protein
MQRVGERDRGGKQRNADFYDCYDQIYLNIHKNLRSISPSKRPLTAPYCTTK